MTQPFLLKTYHNTYLSYSGDTISHTSVQIGEEQKFKIKNSSTPFASDEILFNNICISLPDMITFETLKRNDTISFFDTTHKKFITVEDNGIVGARARKVGSWEEFYLRPTGKDRYLLKSWNDLYLTVNNGALCTTSGADTTNGTFRIIPLQGRKISSDSTIKTIF